MIKTAHCVRWRASKGCPDRVSGRGRPAMPNGGAWRVKVATAHCGVYTQDGFGSRELAAWEADIARRYLLYAGLITGAKLRWNYPERVAALAFPRDLGLVGTKLKYFVRDATALHLGEPDPRRPLA